MKAYNKYFALVLALFSLVSCQEEIRPEDERCVKITAAITPTLITRVSDDGATFSNGDVIRVQNMARSTDNIADYAYSSSAKTWSTSDNLFWEGKQINEFQAWYPAESSYSEFNIPLDQSRGTSSADWMTSRAEAKQSDGIVNFAFAHHLSKVTVSIVDWGTEYAENNRTLNSLHIATVSETVTKSPYDEIIGSTPSNMVKAYSHDDTFSAIIAPGKYEADSDIVHLYINGASEPLVVKTKADINLLSGKAYQYNITIGRDAIVLNDSDVTVTEWIDEELLDQELIDASSGLINLSAQGTANCYIVSKAGSYKFTPTKGNSAQSVGTIDRAVVLWESFGTDTKPSVGELVKNAKYTNGVITFETPSTFKEGNAVIAAKNSSGTILWSWHIWLTAEPQEHEYPNNAGTLMDRNLGATSIIPGDAKAHGLFYQWGRKDPFLASCRNYVGISTRQYIASATGQWNYVLSSSDKGTISYSIKNPTTLIYGEPYTYNDWLYSSTAEGRTRWSSEKTIYDPCPAGWRVPDGGTRGANGFWSNTGFESSAFDVLNYGVEFSLGSSEYAWYPASGYYYSGYHYNMSVVGSSGHFWTATLAGFDAYVMTFYQSTEGTYVVNTCSESDRGDACSVRCYKEGSAGVPVVPSPNPPKEGDYVDENGVNHGQGVNIDNIVWAPVNVGATSTEKYGSYFRWDEAHLACPEGWRLPLDSELTALYVNNQEATLNGVEGRWYSGSNSSTNPTSAIFLPNAGDKYGYLSDGYYWSGTGDYYRDLAHVLSSSSNSSPKIAKEFSCSQPLPVRCVYIQASEVANTQRTIDGLTWSTKNVGAEKYSDSGNYYTDSNVWSGYMCPKGWRIPTYDDMKALKQNYSELVTENGVQGRWFSGSNSNANSSTGIFLPWGGCQYLDRDEATKYDKSSGMYWTSTTIGSNSYWLLSFDTENVGMYRLNYSDRATPIRCVKGTYNGPALEEAAGTNSTQVVIDGLTWSSKNLGAESVNDYGDTYTRNEAMNACPQGWRLPTGDEIKLLLSRYTWDIVDAQSGILCSGFSDGGNEAVFLPTISGSHYGYYWTSSESTSPNYPYMALWVSGDVTTTSASATDEYAVRCVKGSVDLGLDKTEGASYAVTLSPSDTAYGWKSSTTLSPNAFVYDGLYESNNAGKDNTAAVMYIDIVGYETFTIYVRNNGESGCDYTMVSHLDKSINAETPSNDAAVKMYLSSRNASTELSAYKEIKYTGIDKKSHRITIVYIKDGSEDEGTDRGYVMIPIYQ